MIGRSIIIIILISKILNISTSMILISTMKLVCSNHIIPNIIYYRLISKIVAGRWHVLASEVTPGLLTGAELNGHQFYVMIVLMGDQMGRDSGRYRSNSRNESVCKEQRRS
jgi:hypothetical protein